MVLLLTGRTDLSSPTVIWIISEFPRDMAVTMNDLPVEDAMAHACDRPRHGEVYQKEHRKENDDSPRPLGNIGRTSNALVITTHLWKYRSG